ncbi:MAG: hypothetical protein IJF17_11850 [Thermoguttaceae bacterium]|nr:hypothetical protein [Thermoguttaceae bacterium]
MTFSHPVVSGGHVLETPDVVAKIAVVDGVPSACRVGLLRLRPKQRFCQCRCVCYLNIMTRQNLLNSRFFILSV